MRYGTYDIVIMAIVNMMRARKERSLPGFCIGDDDYAKVTEKTMLISGLSEPYRRSLLSGASAEGEQ